MHDLNLNSRLDTPALAKAFAVSGRLQIDAFLEADDAKALARGLETLDWRLVLNTSSKHVDIHASQIAAMTPELKAGISAEVMKKAASQFQYMYENYPVADLAEANELRHAELKAAFELMNSEKVRSFLLAVTGEQVDFCDMQATRYSAGHMLTVHSDEAPGKNRKLAYVLGLTPNWSPVWGGQLQFLDNEHRPTDSYITRFNALAIFRVPQPHHVTQVATFAPSGRTSLTGWFRTRG